MEQNQVFELRACTTDKDLEEYDKVQISVFVEEQEINKEAVMDKTGNVTFFNFYSDDIHVGAVRFNHKEKGYKIERVAILKDQRKKGYGKKMLMAIIEEIKKVIKEGEIIFSEIQAHTKEFYLSCGFDVDVEHPMIIQNIQHYYACLKL